MSRRMTNGLGGLLLALLLGGCLSPEQRAQQDANRMEGLAIQCQGFGLVRGTPELSQCMMQLDQAEQDRRAAIGAAIIGSGMLAPRPQAPYVLPSPAVPARPRQTHCFTTALGHTSCTTY